MRQLGLPSASLACLVSPFMSKNFDLEAIAGIIRLADRSEFMLNIYYEKLLEEDIVKY